jgi:hypothetical protein
MQGSARVFEKYGTFSIMPENQTGKERFNMIKFMEVNVFMNTRSKINENDLVDIKDVVINPMLNKEKRIESFVQQIKNPLCYKCGEYIVQVSFSNNGRTLEDCFTEYLKNL